MLFSHYQSISWAGTETGIPLIYVSTLFNEDKAMEKSASES
jgi:hypothetical protein